MLFLAGDLTQWHLPVGMKDLRLSGSKVKGKVTSLIINMVYAPAAVILHSSFPFHFLPRRSMFFLAGDLTQWHLPVGMKDLNLFGTGVTGKAQLRE